MSKVFGIGAHRTGTTSLTDALETLGFKCSHWDEHREICIDLVDEKYGLDSVLTRFDALTDLPTPSLYRLLDEMYPASKFILTVRDPDAWLASALDHINGRRLLLEEFMFYGVWACDPDLFLARYHAHNADVMRYFSDRPDDLLVMDITRGDGWDKLCPFLGVPVRNDPFPRRRWAGA